MYWSLRNWLTGFARDGASRSTSSTWRTSTRSPPRCARTRSSCGSRRRPIRCGRSPTSRRVCAIAHARGAAVAVDSTVATPVLTQPLTLGADLVMHSATKYLNGHSDVIAGALVTREDTPLWQRIRTLRAQLGSMIGPFEAWLLARGMRTLFPRVEVACRNAQRIAEHFAGHAQGGRGAVPGPALVRRSRSRQAADARRLRRHAVDPRARGRIRGDRDGGAACRYGSARRRSAASRAWSSTARAWKAPARPCPPISCACRSASRTPATSSPTSSRRYASDAALDAIACEELGEQARALGVLDECARCRPHRPRARAACPSPAGST